jgi:cytosine deaminase
MLAIRDRYADAVAMQIIAFPQSGIQAWPGTLELLEEAVRQGADVIGGIDPCMLERDPVANLDALFDLAVRHGAGIDVHLHEPGPLGAFSAELIIERTRVNQLAGRVVISHPDFLGGIAPGQASKIISELVDAGIGVTTNVPGSDPKPPLALMREAGLIVGSGCDGALDSWAPMNRSDMLFKGYELAWRNGLGADEELDLVYDYICTGGALLMGVEDPGLRIGAEADLVLMPGETPIEPIVALPSDRTVIKAGRVVAEGGQFLASRSTAG